MNQLLKLLPVFLGLLILPGCVTHYKKRSLSYLLQTSADYNETQNKVTVEVRKLNNAQTRSLFDGQGRYLLDINAQPLHLKITNDSNTTYLLSDKCIELNSIEGEKIKTALCKGNYPILAIAGQGAFATGLMIYGAIDSSKHIGNVFFYSAAHAAFFTLFVLLIPATIIATIRGCYEASQNVKEYNLNLTEDLAEKNIPESLKIPADTAQEFLFFADATQFRNNFNISLTEKITQKPLTFNITL